ncbi:hypothetical protein KP509_35G034400 [Ceratopteris richardii]|nr:hypothetical protein KP509_35G034400 [Ceratopteris richardii]
MSETLRTIANECGVEFDEDSNAVVIDHLNFAESETDTEHSLIAADTFVASSAILGEKGAEAPVLFQGIAHSVAPANDLVIKVLSASASAYSANPEVQLNGPPSLSGTSISLVSVLQARNNARVLISGSLSLFSNKFFVFPFKKFGSSTSFQRSGNQMFAEEISKWVFHERGHLKAVNVHHHKVGNLEEPSMYRITDHIEYSVEIYEWTGKTWKPYVADDVQVQFYMMSPYILKTLNHNGQGLYTTSFQVPDVYGVFQFKLDYNRLGYTTLAISKQIPVRPFRHNEYERFIPAAYPYYSSSFSMMFGFFLFGVVFLYHK